MVLYLHLKMVDNNLFLVCKKTVLCKLTYYSRNYQSSILFRSVMIYHILYITPGTTSKFILRQLINNQSNQDIRNGVKFPRSLELFVLHDTNQEQRLTIYSSSDRWGKIRMLEPYQPEYKPITAPSTPPGSVLTGPTSCLGPPGLYPVAPSTYRGPPRKSSSLCFTPSMFSNVSLEIRVFIFILFNFKLDMQLSRVWFSARSMISIRLSQIV